MEKRMEGTLGEFGGEDDGAGFPVFARARIGAGTDSQNGATDAAKDFLGQRAGEELVEAVASMSAENDQIGRASCRERVYLCV